MSGQPDKFSVFLSHNSKDKPAVEEIARQLETEHGLTCWLDKWNLIPGEPWQEEIEAALNNCETVAVFVGPSGIGPWQNEEMRVALDKRVKKKIQRVIPVLLPGAPDQEKLTLPDFLTRLTWVDFRTDTDALNALACGIKGIRRGRGKSVPAQPASPSDLPPGSYLPFPRNTFFTGRLADLKSLEKILCSPPALGEGPGVGFIITQAITGMGGLGKTQLAVEFAWQYGCRFKGVHWLDLRDPESLEAQIALCGEKMGLPAWPQIQPEQVTATLHAWLGDGPRLLILDNFEEISKANEVLARLRHSTLRLLVTSRRSDWPTALGLSRLPLDEFTPPESLEFLRKYLPEGRASTPELTILAGHLGQLPLALELAGRYLEKHPRLAIPAYFDQLGKALEHKSMQGWQPERKSLTGHDLSLLQTFALSWEQVKDQITQKLFLLAGYCAPNTSIPPEILEAALEIIPEDCDEASAVLCGLGLLKEGPVIHPLLAEFARRLDKKHSALKVLSEALTKLANQKNAEVDRTGHYDLYRPILPHVRAVAENAENTGLAAAGSLWNSLGYHNQ